MAKVIAKANKFEHLWFQNLFIYFLVGNEIYKLNKWRWEKKNVGKVKNCHEIAYFLIFSVHGDEKEFQWNFPLDTFSMWCISYSGIHVVRTLQNERLFQENFFFFGKLKIWKKNSCCWKGVDWVGKSVLDCLIAGVISASGRRLI